MKIHSIIEDSRVNGPGFRLVLRRQYAGISVSGGEPFCQGEELVQLFEEYRRHGMNTLVYTVHVWRIFLRQGTSRSDTADI